MFAVVVVRCVFSCGVRVFAAAPLGCVLAAVRVVAAASARLRWLGVLAATESAVNDCTCPPVALVTVKVDTTGDKKCVSKS